jgi:hypothetical protein
LVDRWSRAGQPAQRREEILEWFQKAAAVNDASPLPADVEFQADAVDPSISSPPPISLAPPRRAAPDLLNGQPADSAGTRDTGPAPYRPLTSLGTAVIKAVPKSNPFDFVTGNRWRRLRPPTSAPSAPHATVRQPDDA